MGGSNAKFLTSKEIKTALLQFLLDGCLLSMLMCSGWLVDCGPTNLCILRVLLKISRPVHEAHNYCAALWLVLQLFQILFYILLLTAILFHHSFSLLHLRILIENLEHSPQRDFDFTVFLLQLSGCDNDGDEEKEHIT